MLDLTALRKATAQLDEALALCASDVVKATPVLAPHLRAGAIQAFEFSYELTHKLLRRHLTATEPSAPAVADLSFPQLIRLGWERGLLAGEWAQWRVFRDARNATSHAYDENKAAEVFGVIPAFLEESRYLLKAIERRQTGAP